MMQSLSDMDPNVLIAAITAAIGSPIVAKLITWWMARNAGESKEITSLREQLQEEWSKSREGLRAELSAVRVRLEQCEQIKTVALERIEHMEREVLDLKRRLNMGISE